MGRCPLSPMGEAMEEGWVCQGLELERDEVYQVALGRGHAVRKEVDECVEELRPLSVRLVYI